MRTDRRQSLTAYRFTTLPAERVDALVSTRLGGHSRAPYESLNLGSRVGDDRALVLANRRTLFAAYDLPLDRSVWCKQVHRNAVTVVDTQTVSARSSDYGRQDRGALDEASVLPDTDALVTNLTDVPLCVTLADCVPVVLYDPDHHALGVVHAGWGGTVARICSATVTEMTARYGSEPSRLMAGIGPSISPERYEVGRDVINAATAAYGDAAAEILSPAADGKALFDLWTANALDLAHAGVRPAAIEISRISTIDRLDEFYSHRAERETGRFITAARLLPNVS
jgi:YfiH family protein